MSAHVGLKVGALCVLFSAVIKGARKRPHFGLVLEFGLPDIFHVLLMSIPSSSEYGLGLSVGVVEIKCDVHIQSLGIGLARWLC
jgi:hypothetical protein